MKSAKKVIFILILLFFATSGWFINSCWKLINTPLIAKNGQSKSFVFVEGSSIKKAASYLDYLDLFEHPMLFVLYVRLSGMDRVLQAGEYVVEPGMTLRGLVKKMAKGEVINNSFTIVEGWTFAKLVNALNEDSNIKHAIQNLTSEEVMEKIGHAGENPEGRFAPDTYLFRGKITDIDLLINSYNLMKKRLQKAWNNKASDLPYHCPYDALIIASLIEKETAVPEERSIISGVIIRRLKKGMLLQIDPTVIYGMGDSYSGKLTRKDLKKDTAYNTYTRRGLPPTPIAMSGEESIIAAMHPAEGTALYYVSKGDGTHKFSDTHKEQIKAIKKYLRK